jgi:hypothetical protein
VTRAKISQYSATAGDNTDVNGVDIAEGCPPSSMNNMGREIMAALKRFQVGSDGDGVTVGGSLVVSGSTTANTFSATNVTASGNLTFTGTGNRITGDMSNATVANRLFFQNSVTNGSSQILMMPNGTGTSSSFIGYNSSDPANASLAAFQVIGSTDVRLQSTLAGTGSYLPMTFFTGGSERMRIDTSGRVGIGTSSPSYKLQVSASDGIISVINGTTKGVRFTTDSNGSAVEGVDNTGAASYQPLSVGGSQLQFTTSGTERMRIDTSGNLLVGTTSQIFGSNFLTNLSGTRPLAIKNTSTTAGDNSEVVWHVATTGSNRFIEFGTEASYTIRGSIDYNRTDNLTRYNTTSDATLKNILSDSDGTKSVEILNSTRIREFAWKDDPTQKPQIGVIAQELYETYKGAVSVGGEQEDGTYRPWAVDKTAFTFHLVAGWQAHERMIQELKAELDTVKAELATLKGN